MTFGEAVVLTDCLRHSLDAKASLCSLHSFSQITAHKFWPIAIRLAVFGGLKLAVSDLVLSGSSSYLTFLWFLDFRLFLIVLSPSTKFSALYGPPQANQTALCYNSDFLTFECYL